MCFSSSPPEAATNYAPTTLDQTQQSVTQSVTPEPNPDPNVVAPTPKAPAVPLRNAQTGLTFNTTG